ncbi:hypothetical protein NDA18_001824 [Ustilago nuda]|nr:hypothetical protein NDA18_001824 [Ustilago nuda]
MLTSLPPFLFVIVARTPSKKMRVRGRSSRQQPWWLFVIALSYVLILTFSSAAPNPPDGAISDDKDLYPPQNRITNVQQGRQWWISTASPRIARARSKLSSSMGAFLGRYSSEGPRLRKTEPRRGEVEIKPIYSLSPEESNLPSLPRYSELKDTSEVRKEHHQHMTQPQEKIAYLLNKEPDNEEDVQRLMDEKAVEAARVKVATDRALQQSNPELSAGVSGVPKAVSLSGVPSDLLASKSAKSIGQGAQSFVNAPPVHHAEHFGASKDIELRYPGEEVVIRGSPKRLFFFHPLLGYDDKGPFKPREELSREEKRVVDKILRKNKFSFSSFDRYNDRLGWSGDHLHIGRFPVPGHGVETIRVSSRKDFLRPWRKIPVVYRSKFSFGSLFGTPFSRLPSHFSSWLKDYHPDVYENLAKARLRKRAPVPPQNYMTAA